ncbi:ESPR-type extended signal peptide-containing protein [Burkholderia gladioli]|uniref:ESPR-type extended signal peptide-containing protein n=1 Tax=Burkholderia gladioli TaxID=28095 RepID=UPI002FE0CEC9
MNKNNYRLVFSRIRGMLIAVEETANASGNAGRGEMAAAAQVQPGFARFALRHAAFAALVMAGAVPSWVNAQIVGGGAHAPSVIQTQNGLPRSISTNPAMPAFR